MISAVFAFQALHISKGLARPYAIVTPHLDNEGKHMGAYLSNEGTGPAILKEAILNVDGKEYRGLGDTVWPKVLEDLRYVNVNCFRSAWPAADSVIRAGNETPLITVREDTNNLCFMSIVDFLTNHDVRLTLRYESLYGDSFESKQSLKISDERLFDAARVSRAIAIRH
ncbi:hypothetical protein [Pandoraea sp. NPDC087047]|uniref:hypothetical protein n=1 Tax=Pandoraea sp. NPDC087047 TaxID=3364390 RepID=UPI0038052AB2